MTDKSYFTVVFKGDVGDLPFNPLTEKTSFGEVVTVGRGDAFADFQWRTIDTAPKDGRNILLYGIDGNIRTGYWGIIDDHPCWIIDSMWAYIPPGPTHWMPLLDQYLENSK